MNSLIEITERDGLKVVDGESYYPNLTVRSDGKAGKGKMQFFFTVSASKEICMASKGKKKKQNGKLK